MDLELDPVLAEVDLSDADPESGEATRPAPEVEDPAALRDDSVTGLYYREMGRIPTLTAEQELRLGREIRAAREAIWAHLAKLPLTRLYIFEILRREKRDAPLALQALEAKR